MLEQCCTDSWARNLSQIHGLGPYTVLRLIAECGDDMTRWPTAKHFTSWRCLAPANKISGGRVLSAATRRSSNRAAALLRIAAVNVGRTQTSLGAFYRRLAARIGKAQAVTATARKLAVLFYKALRFGMAYADPGASAYEMRSITSSCASSGGGCRTTSARHAARGPSTPWYGIRLMRGRGTSTASRPRNSIGSNTRSVGRQ